MPGSQSNFPAQIQAMLQKNYLQTALQEYLIPNIQYYNVADHVPIPMAAGDTMTKTRPGLLPANPDPIDPTTLTGLDNGMTVQQWALEQYTLTIQQLQGTQDIDLLTKGQSIVDRFDHSMQTNLVQAAQSVDIYLRNCLYGGLVPSGANLTNIKEGYLAGNSFARTAQLSTDTTIAVDDITGFASLYVNGVLTNVSPSNPILATVYATAGPAAGVAVTITGVSQDVSNLSKRLFTGPGAGGKGASGVLTLLAAIGTAVVAGDTIAATDGCTILRPNAKSNYTKLAASDTFSQAQILDAVALLRNRQVPPMPDGRYLMVCDYVSMRQIFGDQDYKIATQGRFDSAFFKGAFVDNYLDVHIIQSSNAPVQLPATGGSTVTVRRPVICGADVLVDGYYDGVKDFANTGSDAASAFTDGAAMAYFREEREGTAIIVRPPIDRQSRSLSMSWISVRDAIAPTDATATSSVILTGDNARRKRAVIVEHAG